MIPALSMLLYKAVHRTVERVAGEGIRVPASPCHTHAIATVRFHGAVHGQIQLHVDAAALGSISTALLGHPVDEPTLQLDALGEVASIICGVAFPTVAPRRTFVQLPPVASFTSHAAPQIAHLPAATVSFQIADGLGAAHLFLFDRTDAVTRV